ncbi:MAG: OmpA family protein [Alphaproteobacteria bacterium]
MMTARKVSFISKAAFATALLIGSGYGAQAQSVIVNYGALDQLDDAAPAAQQPTNPAAYATGQGYPFQTGPAAAAPYGTAPQPQHGYAPTPMAAPAPAVQATTTYSPAPSMADFPAPSGPEGYNRIMILGSPKMTDEARRTGQLPYSQGTREYRQQLATMVGAGAKARPMPTTNSAAPAPDLDRTTVDTSSGELPRRLAAYSRDGRPPVPAKQERVLETTGDGLPRRISEAPSAYHKSSDGLIRRVSAKSGTIGLTRELLIEASQTPTGLPPLLIIKFQEREQDLTGGDRSSLAPVMQQISAQNSQFEIIGFASDGDSRVARKRSLDRTMAVRNFMIQNGISADRIKIRARGAEATRSGQVHDQVIIGGQ